MAIGHDEVEVSPIKEISEEERKCRNLLGLKVKGPIDRKKLTKNFELRMLNYEEEKLEKMSASKRRSSLEKKERLEAAFDFLKSLSED